MGKTLGNVISLDILKRHFQTDVVRYFVLREMVFGQDGNFGYENLIDRATADLANGLGNLSSRTLSMIAKYRDGKVPSGAIRDENVLNAKRAGLATDDQELASVLARARDEFLRRFDNFEFSHALETAWTVIARIDKMITDSKPWILAKDPNQAESLNAVLYRSAETLRWLCVWLSPVMPEAAAEIWRQLGLEGDPAAVDPASLEWGGLAAGTAIGETAAVFPRLDKARIMAEIEEQKQEDAVPAEAPVAEPVIEENFITIDDFLKVELKIGEVLVCERIPKADKLLRFEIDLGEDKPRQILAGLAEYYEPEKLIGRKVVVVSNLKPRMMRGLESQGMICAASLDGDDTPPAMATFAEEVKNGARLR